MTELNLSHGFFELWAVSRLCVDSKKWTFLCLYFAPKSKQTINWVRRKKWIMFIEFQHERARWKGQLNKEITTMIKDSKNDLQRKCYKFYWHLSILSFDMTTRVNLFFFPNDINIECFFSLKKKKTWWKKVWVLFCVFFPPELNFLDWNELRCH